MNAIRRRALAAFPSFLLSITMFGSTGNVNAETFTVCPVVSGKRCDYATVQEAIDAARSGDTIQIEPGVYEGSVSQIDTKDITIKGAGATQTILYGGRCGPPPPGLTECAAFTCLGGATVRISNVTLTHHRNTYGAGIVNVDCTITVNRSKIQHNNVETRGGGIENHGTLILENVDVQNNLAERGGGIANFAPGIITIARSDIQNNRALTTPQEVQNAGGGILNLGGTVVVEDTDISNNRATGGGGIANTGNLFLKRSSVHGNISEVDGGGIWNSGTVLLAKSFFDANTAAGQGGAIFESGGLIFDTAGETWYVGHIPNHCANAEGEIPCP